MKFCFWGVRSDIQKPIQKRLVNYHTVNSIFQTTSQIYVDYVCMYVSLLRHCMHFIFLTLNPRISLFQAGSYSKKSQFSIVLFQTYIFELSFTTLMPQQTKAWFTQGLPRRNCFVHSFLNFHLACLLTIFMGGGSVLDIFVMCYLSAILEQLIFDYQHFRTEI